MDPHARFCHNPDCPARGQAGLGKIHIHSRAERRYRWISAQTQQSNAHGSGFGLAICLHPGCLPGPFLCPLGDGSTPVDRPRRGGGPCTRRSPMSALSFTHPVATEPV
jgi:hypothetical protein